MYQTYTAQQILSHLTSSGELNPVDNKELIAICIVDIAETWWNHLLTVKYLIVRLNRDFNKERDEEY